MAAVSGVLVLGVAAFAIWRLDQPLALPEFPGTQRLLDRHGAPLAARPEPGGIWREPVTLEQVSPYYLEALLTFEDRRFYYHPGVDPLALLRAAIGNARHGRVISGGSTLTMQVARLLYPESRSLTGKLRQTWRALQLEWQLSKREILELYLNLAPFGGTQLGIGSAATTYLGKRPADLTRAEAALLAALPQAPSRLRPDRYPERARAARDKVLGRLAHYGVWSPAEVAAAQAEQVAAIRLRPAQHAPLLATRLLTAGSVTTTLEVAAQLALEDSLAAYASGLPPGTTAAALLADTASGAVRAYVGTALYADATRFGHVDMVRARRSPGSTLKPLLYGLALDERLIHSQSLLLDVPSAFGDYRPDNFSGGFAGPVSATWALAQSLNVPAVALLDRYGPERFTSRLASAGLQLEIPGRRPNLSVILGGAGTDLWTLAQTYTALGAGGQVRPLHITGEPPPARFLMSPAAAYITWEMLTHTPEPAGVWAAPGRPIAWKTGTSYGGRDSWAVAVSARHTLAVWVGRPDGTALPEASGRELAGPLLFRLAKAFRFQDQPPPRPQAVADTPVCWPLGLAAAQTPAEHCHRRLTALTIEGAAPATAPDPERPHWANPLELWLDHDGRRRNQHCPAPSQPTSIAWWPAAAEPWLPTRWRLAQALPALAANCPDPGTGAAQLTIETPRDGARVRPARPGWPVTLTLSARGGSGCKQWFADGVAVGSSCQAEPLTLQLTRKGGVHLAVVDGRGERALRLVTVE